MFGKKRSDRRRQMEIEEGWRRRGVGKRGGEENGCSEKRGERRWVEIKKG